MDTYNLTMDDWEDILCFGDGTGLTSVLSQDRPMAVQQLPQDNRSSHELSATDTLAAPGATPKATHPPTSDSCSPDTLMWELQSLSLDSSTSNQQDAEDSYAQRSAPVPGLLSDESPILERQAR